MSSRAGVRKVLRDLVRKYDQLSKRFDESFEKSSMSQLVKQVDALTRLARLILSYRGVLEIEEKEEELTRVLSELRREMESDKTALRTVKSYEASGMLGRVVEAAVSEIKKLKLFLLGGGES